VCPRRSAYQRDAGKDETSDEDVDHAVSSTARSIRREKGGREGRDADGRKHLDERKKEHSRKGGGVADLTRLLASACIGGGGKKKKGENRRRDLPPKPGSEQRQGLSGGEGTVPGYLSPIPWYRLEKRKRKRKGRTSPPFTSAETSGESEDFEGRGKGRADDLHLESFLTTLGAKEKKGGTAPHTRLVYPRSPWRGEIA